MSKKRFIIWNPRDGAPFRDDEGNITSSGLVGRIGEDNAFLRAYAGWPDERRPGDLEVGQRIEGVKYSLSVTTGHYEIWRVL